MYGKHVSDSYLFIGVKQKKLNRKRASSFTLLKKGLFSKHTHDIILQTLANHSLVKIGFTYSVVNNMIKN